MADIPMTGDRVIAPSTTPVIAPMTDMHVVDPSTTHVVDLTEDAAPGTQIDADVVVVAAEGEDGEKLPKNAALQPDGSVILTLAYPLTMRWRRQGSDQERVESRTTLVMHRLNGAAMRAVMAAGAGHAVTTGIAKCCRIDQALFNKLYDRMDGADAAAAAQVFSFFLSGGAAPPTGQPSSP